MSALGDTGNSSSVIHADTDPHRTIGSASHLNRFLDRVQRVPAGDQRFQGLEGRLADGLDGGDQMLRLVVMNSAQA
jgi:hypothetical protein